MIDRSIRGGARIGGTNLWVLFFAILIASVGLNVNSTAVVIGAMLISPLMGPLLAIGYGAGISDSHLIRNAGRGLGVFVLLSVFTSTVYFYLSPLSEAHTELLARTSPTLWDVLIAFFGGCAGIIAHTRRDVSTIIPGAAIATALMPPLCTVGYGLANGHWNFAAGAAYLFVINAFFIALATYLFVKLLRLPEHKEADPRRRLRVHLAIGVCMLTLTVPSGFLAYRLVQDQLFLAASRDVSAALERQRGVLVLSKETSLKERRLSIVIGGNPVSPAEQARLQQRLQSKGFVRATLQIRSVGEKLDVIALREQLRRELQADRAVPEAAEDKAFNAMRIELAKANLQRSLQAQVIRELLAAYPDIKTIAVGDGVSGSRDGQVVEAGGDGAGAGAGDTQAGGPVLVLAIEATPALAQEDLVRIRAGLAARFPDRAVAVQQAAPPAPVRQVARKVNRRGS
ncbi:DUF389 domain-containing protein [Massilia sp. PAMC28688]|uniref:DUF389 domain-containing protein n=1 Tax=Massilia sp. PAMC28688 TaxID=2861283 RepID=UPI001C63A347|nr:DUF389 domain-containing protein [Massilia sp. PAMC28688]QYF92907.1 DUF389 domain-containing protein [Massilia sp. PAMC28688]